MKRTFEEWMKLVDAELESRISLSSMELPDSNYRDSYDQGTTPRAMATKVIREAKEEFDC